MIKSLTAGRFALLLSMDVMGTLCNPTVHFHCGLLHGNRLGVPDGSFAAKIGGLFIIASPAVHIASTLL